MDENKVAGSIEEIKGAAKVAIGQATGDAKLQSDGEADKVVGKIQNAASGLQRRGARHGSHEVRGPPLFSWAAAATRIVRDPDLRRRAVSAIEDGKCLKRTPHHRSFRST